MIILDPRCLVYSQLHSSENPALLSHPPLPTVSWQNVRAGHRSSLKWKPSAYLPLFPAAPPAPPARLVNLSSREAYQVCWCLSFFHTTAPSSTPTHSGASRDLRDPQSCWTSHGSTDTSLLCLYPVNHVFVVICMTTLLHLTAQGVFWFYHFHYLGLLGHSGLPTADLV